MGRIVEFEHVERQHCEQRHGWMFGVHGVLSALPWRGLLLPVGMLLQVPVLRVLFSGPMRRVLRCQLAGLGGVVR